MPITPETKALSERKVVVAGVRILTYVVYAYLIVVEIILVIGFFLLLFGANPTAGFTQWAYRNLDRVMAPFRGIFSPVELGTTSGNVEAVFDTSVIFAMIIYGIIALLLRVLIDWLTERLHEFRDAESEIARQAEVDRRAAEVRAAVEASMATPAATPAGAPPATATPTPPAAATPAPPAGPYPTT